MAFLVIKGENSILEQFEEEFAVKFLLSTSNEFKNYYSKKRQKIPVEITWLKGSSINVGISAEVLWDNDENMYIRLPDIPVLPKNAFSVAHELEHAVIRYTEGRASAYPADPSNSLHKLLAYYLSSSIEDPIVDAELQRYGFDLESVYIDRIVNYKHQLQLIGQDLNPFFLILNQVAFTLQWDIISNNRLNCKNVGDWSNFMSWFEEKYSDLFYESTELVELIRTIGYQSVTHRTRVLEMITKRYGKGNYDLGSKVHLLKTS
jgi:hypothetical protein